ncbi:E2F-associated phosphoprotein [Arabidopsis thaliana x Arabidopsis arenosa]|uniref:E2F-associated phosphoprotein n=1 Tax=Arabidopsis thaliana x Arabidopsis arenosa TaxID=1240361 RepID=A0A8T1YU21_9BRAS|nr:E2F-associated phosphoprotein [Arabidopsis thaliana x Arabidopsis arenosa]
MASPTNSQKTVSDDDEVDYSIKPEFYDSDLDDKDELWMVKKRDGRTSDAVLSCPACFTTVCLECQRHEKYVTQYRAVFVVNCKVDTDRVLQQNAMPSKVGKRRRDSEMQETGSEDSEKVNPVFCSACSTEIGVVDSEEIYHFFNVIPSEP